MLVVRNFLNNASPEINLFDGLVSKFSHAEFEFPVPRGRVDLVVFHWDGGITVCEVKDGSRGMQSVLAGIGQVMAYALQLGMGQGAVSYINKALLFSRCAIIEEDRIICQACESAGILAIPMGSEDEYLEAINVSQGV